MKIATRLLLFCSLLFGAMQAQVPMPAAPPAPVSAPAWATVESAVSGLAGDGIALFVPPGLDPARLPVTLSLLQPPKITGPLPAGWRIKPVFSSTDGKFRATVDVAADIDLYGGGEVTGPLRRNGQEIELWNTDSCSDGRINGSRGKRLYQTHPWIMGVRPDGSAFGVLFDSIWKAELSCSRGITFTCEGPAFPVLVIERESPQAVVQCLAALTGTISLPARWTLGYQQCRFSYHPDSQVRTIADDFRSRKIPCDVIWMDIDYMDGYRIFTFKPAEFPNPAGLNDYLHQKGFKSVWMIDPGVKVDETYSVYASGRQQDVFVKTARGDEFHGNVWPGPCAFPDFTRPETRAWWAGLYKDYMATGIDGVWNDMNEPSVFGGRNGTMPEDNQHRGGGELTPGPHRQYHNVFGRLMVHASRAGIQAANPGKRPFVLTRANSLGGQRDAATWTGDNYSTDASMRSSVPQVLTLGLSGQPFSGPDLGGFAGNCPGQLWAEWVGFGNFFPFCRGHASCDTNRKEPWSFGPDVEKTAKMALERRYRLLPYLYTLFEEASRNGMPVMRPVFMADAKDLSLRAEDQAFLLGGDLLVVPSFAREVKLPRGNWPVVSLIPGDREDKCQAELRIRPGAIVPLGKVIQNTTEKSLDPLTLLVCLDGNGTAEGTLYEDAGEGFDYRAGDFCRTAFRAERKDGKVVVTVAATAGRRQSDCPKFAVQIVE